MHTVSLGLVDPEQDPNRTNYSAHYRIYDDPDQGPRVVYLQDDYATYDGDRFLSYAAYDTRNAAEIALLGVGCAVAQLADRFRAVGLLP